jgi:hypothetical protein
VLERDGLGEGIGDAKVEIGVDIRVEIDFALWWRRSRSWLRGWEGLVDAYVAAELGQPGEGAFHDPAAVEQDEALGLVGVLDDRHGQVPDLARVADPAYVSGVGPHQGDRGERLVQRGGDAERTVAVLWRRRAN